MMTPKQEQVLDAADRFVAELEKLPSHLWPMKETDELYFAVKAEQAERFHPFVESPIGYYVSEEDAEKFDSLLQGPFAS